MISNAQRHFSEVGRLCTMAWVNVAPDGTVSLAAFMEFPGIYDMKRDKPFGATIPQAIVDGMRVEYGDSGSLNASTRETIALFLDSHIVKKDGTISFPLFMEGIANSKRFIIACATEQYYYYKATYTHEKPAQTTNDLQSE